jgi:hypothetical protein
MDSSAGDQVTAPDELRRAAQDSVREYVAAAAEPGRLVRLWDLNVDAATAHGSAPPPVAAR